MSLSQPKQDNIQLIIVSGRSGSGKSVALRVLEDLGFYCIDNLPLSLLNVDFYSIFEIGMTNKIAVSLDVRNMPKNPLVLQQIRANIPEQVELTVLFIDASDQELIRRYSETRRLHPLSYKELSLEQSIEAESLLLEPIKETASLIIDTTELSIHDLSEVIRARILGKTNRKLVLVFESFGFKYGLPKDADYVFDVRFLPNPHWDPVLRPLTGLDGPVKQFLSKEADVNNLIYQIRNFIACWLPLLEKSNRSYVTIAIGCTGGQHRSVYIAQQLAESFEESQHNVQIRHRRLEKKAK